MSNRLLIPAAVAIAALSLAACNKGGEAPKPVEKPPVATVNGKPIPAAVFAVVAQGQTNKKPEELTAEQRKQVTEQLVELYVAAQEAEKENLQADPEVGARIEFQRLNVLASALVQKQMKGKTPTEQELRAEYDRQVAQMPKLEYHARHILVKEEQQARDAIAALNKGAKFEDLAKKVSIDGSKAQGGDLNWFTPERMVKPFAEALEKLNKGEYTKEPVKSDFGYHVILLLDTRPNNPPPFEAVKDRLAPMVQQRQLHEYIEGLRKAALIQGL
ncbi:MAG TPA: peptidylprolyl isomerase [Steroidobacteraceae bacterium]|nr:peptidylprolyl isomerase [Steroidobacteraceae bacterium]